MVFGLTVSTLGCLIPGLVPDFGFSGVSVECNYSDLCSDADSLALSQLVKQVQRNPHSLSRVMREYYSSLSEARRYSAYRHDLGDDFSPVRLATVVQEKMAATPGDVVGWGLKKFYKETTDDEKMACCRAFASYLGVRVRR